MTPTVASDVRGLGEDRGFWIGWSAALVTGSVLFIAVLLPPFVGETPRHVVMAVFSSVCHQIPTRSPHVDGIQLAVCHRCLGIYGALALAPLAFLVLRGWDEKINDAARWFILAAILIPGIDWLGDLLGFWTNTIASRIATGAAFGITAGYFLCRALVELARGRGEQRGALANRPTPTLHAGDDAVRGG